MCPRVREKCVRVPETNEVDCVEMVTERGRYLCGGGGPDED